MKSCDPLNKEIVILGNGRSLSEINLDSIMIESIGMNNAHRYWEKINWYPTYYASLDKMANINYADEIFNLVNCQSTNGIKKFLLRTSILDSYPELRQNSLVEFWEDKFKFSKPITTGSGSVLWALSMNISVIYLIGIDCNYKAQRSPKNIVHLNTDYFYSDYYQINDPEHLSTRTNELRNESHLKGFSNISKKLKIIDQKIYVSTRNSNLYEKNIFEYVPIPSENCDE